jgi:hypothetical protein
VYSEKSMFPMMGVGVFNIMFWTGFVVGHNIGLACSAMLLNALLFGSLGSYAVVKLERFTNGAYRSRKSKEKSTAINLEHLNKPVLQT